MRGGDLGVGWCCVALIAVPWVAASSADDVGGRLFQAWEVPISNRVEVCVPGDVADVGGALEGIARWTISASSWVTIRLGPGVYEQKGRLTVHHPFGARLAIMGMERVGEASVLRWAREVDGIYVGQNHVLGGLDCLRMEHVLRKARGHGSGVLADEGGHIHCGSNLVVVGFYYGFTARRNGTIRCQGAVVEDSGDAGYFAYMGGHIDACRSRSKGADDSGVGLGSGYVAEYGGSIDAGEAVAEGCFLAGFQALSGGTIRAERSEARRNRGGGYRVRDGGVIVAHGYRATDNAGGAVVNPFGDGVFVER
ncbi:MAG TPA: hypothetical protein PLU30_05095 [Verrucomicrobiae bacterium]|nr:hypothetical protein [Verrucomicrobiae bacterium]